MESELANPDARSDATLTRPVKRTHTIQRPQKHKINHYENEEHLRPLTLEQKYYRTLFDTYYPHCCKVLPYFWMPRFIKANDASARTLKIYKDENTNVKSEITKEN